MNKYESAKVKTEIIKAMAHPARLMIIESLDNGEKLFSELFALFDCDKSTISKHLLVLKNAGIVSAQKKGLDVLYKLETKCIIKFLDCINTVINTSIKKQKACLRCK
ncbi:MAG TPA: metalloregulator ArsR/SmtB family transcription factor [bacterium]|nr:metalloregulator ArsR/SmtB family transcription factor [bacterium]HPN29932.1 metalloregulator ArsR/SmtB family transcription factor [bacterium]